MSSLSHGPFLFADHWPSNVATRVRLPAGLNTKTALFKSRSGSNRRSHLPCGFASFWLDGTDVSYATLRRWAQATLGIDSRSPTVRVADPRAGEEARTSRGKIPLFVRSLFFATLSFVPLSFCSLFGMRFPPFEVHPPAVHKNSDTPAGPLLESPCQERLARYALTSSRSRAPWITRWRDADASSVGLPTARLTRTVRRRWPRRRRGGAKP